MEKGAKKVKIISLNGNRKLINACKKAGLPLHNPQGEWNGYGYKRLPLAVTLSSLKEVRKFNKIKRELEKIPVKKPKTPEEIREKWAKRLVKLTGISMEDALEIAQEKEDYKQEQIYDLEERQIDHYSRRRQTLINQITRSNPLRYIKDSNHAQNILAAHHRHSETNYENLLDEGRELAAEGQIARSEVKDYARQSVQL